MNFRYIANRAFLLLLFAAAAFSVPAQNVKRVVIVKIDGLPGYYVDRFVKLRDPETGKSVLPWFDEVFYKSGTRVPNFYTRGMSLSGPSWGQLDTGQHLQIKGNVEYDRFTLKSYDYLNFFPYYIGYGLSKKVDMPAVEVMDQLNIPLLCDAFPFEKRYTSQQLYQRGNDWAVLASGFVNMFPGDPGEFIDEWTLGFNFRKITIDQVERDILGKLVKRPDIDYYDYYDVSFDHVSHHNNDTASRFAQLKELDRLIGRFWMAIQESSRAGETALVLVSDHGFNSQDKVYSQGFNLVKLLAGPSGGGHHVVTKRRLMLDYSVKGLYPLVPLIKTTSKDSAYLQGQSDKYPTALVDFDGNERSSLHLRDSDLNILHILFQQLKTNTLEPVAKTAAMDAVFKIIDKHRSNWQKTVVETGEELDALNRWTDQQKKIIPTLQLKDRDPLLRGVTEKNRRIVALADLAVQNETDYRKYLATLGNLLSINRETFDARKLNIENVVQPGAMGEPNSVYDLQNYVTGLSPGGLTLDANNNLDLEKSFTRVNYLDLIHSQKVRNNVQAEVSSRPVDFIAVRVPVEVVAASLPTDSNTTEDPIWLFGGAEKQALILSRVEKDGGLSYRYLPVTRLRQDADGKVTFQPAIFTDGFPLRYFEAKDFGISTDKRSAWLNDWHTETEWLNATHTTAYSNAIIGLNEQLDRHPVFDADDKDLSPDELLLRRFRQRQRHLTESDLLILANNHWNFDVRGFNPGGNHGSFFRVSTNSTFMIAGGHSTGIPRGLAVDEPYDSLSFMPTILRLMGKVGDGNRPVQDLQDRGFRKFPGRLIKEITEPVR